MSDLSKRDDDLADFLLEDGIANKLKYDHARQQWHYWDRWHWRRDAKKIAYRTIFESNVRLLKGATGEKLRALQDLLNLSKKESVLKTLAFRQEVAMTGDEWDPEPRYMGVKNGVLDLANFELHREPHPEWLVSRTADVEWNEDATCPQFEKFVLEIMGGDREMVDYLLSVLGYAMFGWQREQKFWIWVGGGNNGKGTLAKVVSRIFGEYADTPSSELYMKTKFGSASASAPRAELVKLQGVRFTWMSEPQGHAFNDELVKAHTGDDPIQARPLYSNDFITFRPTHTLVFLTNDPPSIEDVGPSMRRRVRVIDFEQDFTATMDTGLEDRLVEEEKEGIFLSLAAYARRYAELTEARQVLAEPRKITERSARYIEENDPVARFVSEWCVLGRDHKVVAARLYDSYVQWVRENGEVEKSQTGFGLAVGKRFQKFKARDGLFYKGLGLKSAMDVAMSEEDE